jgi:hypothetical protein
MIARGRAGCWFLLAVMDGLFMPGVKWALFWRMMAMLCTV